MTFVDRSCAEVSQDSGTQPPTPITRPLSEYRAEPAYVLLGDPGAGKTTCFEQECERAGNAAEVIRARDFITLKVCDHPEWRNKTLFIDGLDEIRAGDGDIRAALDRVRGQLDRLKKPPFRLSCREADWLGRNDLERLRIVAPEGRVKVLRLDPLSAAEAEEIVAEAQLEDPAAFLAQARERGLEGFLRNPQNLDLLATAVTDGRWPDSRRELFEVAGRHLISEENQEHRDAERERPAHDQLLEAAGRVCALLLLSGTAGVDLSSSASDDDGAYPPLSHLDPQAAGTSAGDARASARLQRLAVSSRLFSATRGASPNSQRFEPIHRHMAEFLAGRYLAQLIDAGLPAARVAALITAGDGGVVTAHRGLSAWLAVHSRLARADLIDRDPIGVGLYGDIASFSSEERRLLLEALIREARRLYNVGYRNVAAFAPLATPALEEPFRKKLTTKPRSDDDQLGVDFVLRVLCQGAPIAALVEPVLAIIRAREWWPRVSYAALDAFIHQCANREARISELKRVLTDIQNGRMPDPDNQLAATVLDNLYPDVITPSEIWAHLGRCQPTKLYGRHRVFWTKTLEAKTSEKALPALLDGLVKERPDLGLVFPTLPHGRALAERLLARALPIHGSELSPDRLHDWLSAPAGTYDELFELRSFEAAWADTARVRSWLQDHPAAYYAALLQGLVGYTNEQDLHRRWAITRQRLRETQPPSDFGLWCVHQVQELAETQPELARWLFRLAVGRLSDGETTLSQELLDECAEAHPFLGPSRPNLETANELWELEKRQQAAVKTRLQEKERQNRKWLEAVRNEAGALRQNRGAPALLHELAWEWSQSASRRSISLSDWLQRKFQGEPDLAEAALTALRGTLERDDLPDVEEILRLDSESRMHYLGVPILAALKDGELNARAQADDLSEEQWRLALAVNYCVPTDLGSHPGWYRHLIAQRADLAASVLLPLARSGLRRGSEHVPGLYELADDPEHKELARIVSLPLLSGFPVRAPARQLRHLNHLLWAALRYADRDALHSLIAKKTASKSMTANQRVYWLAAGFLVAPATHRAALEHFVSGKELRARQLAQFLWAEYPNPFQPGRLPVLALEALIRLLGHAFGTYELRDGIVDPPQMALQHIPELIQHLAASPRAEASGSLHRLAEDPALSAWRYHLLVAVDQQATIARDSSYKRPGVKQVRAALDDLAPANAADLAALGLDRLGELSTTIRQANTNEWGQYWNEDEHGRPSAPKHEESCRNALLAHLKRLLPPEVDAQPEGRYAANRRADIRLSCSSFHVPIEIKKQSHPSLWRAARDQLVALYTSDPATGGHGIFLVLWFGGDEKTTLDETGTRPANPEDLKQRLDAGLVRQLPSDQLRKIGVRVIDVSKPCGRPPNQSSA